MHKPLSRHPYRAFPSRNSATPAPVGGRILSCLLLSTFLFSGCNRDEITSYRVPKQTPADTAVAAAPESRAPGQVRWVTPSGWKELPAGEYRVGGFKIETNGQTAEVSITPFPGVSGIELDSVNMWRQTLGLAPLDAAGFAKKAETVAVGDTEGKLFDLAGSEGNTTNKNRTIGAVTSHDGTMWFVKMTGADRLVAAQKPTFQTFLKSLEFLHGAESNLAAGPATDRPMGPIDRQMPERVAGSGGHPGWKIPAGWVEQQPASSMLLASYSAPAKSGGNVAVTVSNLAGDGGGLLQNVNRWRRQIGLAPIGEADLPQSTSPVDVVGTKGILVDLTTQAAPKGMLIFVVPRDGNTWFYKMTGEAAAIAEQKQNVLEFAATAH